ncbi:MULTISPECIES: ligand-binding sensor domain-containing protein [Chitinophagaceae]
MEAQSNYFRRYQVEQGLSNNTATCIVQDNKGFIWIGTKDGLNRFDGYNFKTFRQNPHDSTSLGNNSVWKLYAAKNGTLWIGTERGIYYFNPTTETFAPLPNAPRAWVRKIAEDSKGNLWFIIDFQLFEYNIASKQTLHFDNLSIQNCSTLEVLDNGQLWIGTGDGRIGQYNPATDSYQSYSLFTHSPSPISAWIERIYDYNHQYLLVGTSSQGVKKFDKTTHTYSDILTYNQDKTPVYARDFMKQSGDKFWVGTESGIYICDINMDTYVHWEKHYNDPYSLNDNAIYSFYKDKEDGIWVGSYFGGVNYYPKSNPLFEKYLPNASTNAIQGNAVREIVSDEHNNIWIGTEDGGLNKFNTQTQIFSNKKPDGKAGSIAHSNIHGLLRDGDTLWIGTFEHGLDIMDLKTEKVVRHFNSSDLKGDLHSNFVHSIYKTSEHTIWLGTSNGIYTYNSQKNNFEERKEFPAHAFYSSILETEDGTIWAGTFQHGLHYTNPKRNIYGELKIFKNKKNLLTENRITYLYQSHDNHLWIATENGLYSVSVPTMQVVEYSAANGLPSNLIYTVTQDQLDRFWITSSKGLILLNANGKLLRTFTQTNGLLGDQFNYSSVLNNSDGYIYYGSLKGLIRFNPLTLKQDNYVPPLYITNFSVLNQPLTVQSKGYLTQSLLITRQITLPYNQSTFNIDFAALNYESPDNVQYAYILEGLDENWNLIKNNRSVYFTNLPYGKYVFKVHSTNSSGLWQNNEYSLSIIITPPFWKTGWAYLLYFLLGAGIVIYAIASYRNYFYNKHKRDLERYTIQKEKELIQSKIDFFTNVVHEIRTPLTLIKAPLEKIVNQIEQLPNIRKYVLTMQRNTERMILLSDELLNFQRTEINGFELKLRPINIAPLLAEIIEQFEYAASIKNITIKTHLLNESIMAALDKEAFVKIVSNLINNAIKYANSLLVIETATFTLPSNDMHGRQLHILFKNDGKKITDDLTEKIFEPFYRLESVKPQPGMGLGLALARSLAILQKGTLTFVPTDDVFNIFLLTLPLL